jgi:hypothetical protein
VFLIDEGWGVKVAEESSFTFFRFDKTVKDSRIKSS